MDKNGAPVAMRTMFRAFTYIPVKENQIGFFKQGKEPPELIVLQNLPIEFRSETDLCSHQSFGTLPNLFLIRRITESQNFSPKINNPR